MMKFFNKMDKHTFILMFSAFLWILICNIIVQLLHEPLTAGVGNWTWTIFLANVLFFIKGNPKHVEALLENACGGIFGLIGAMGLISLNTWFAGMGISTLSSTILAIAVFLFLTIALHPMVPYVFNNMSLCFFLVALINAGAFYVNPDLGVSTWGTQPVLMSHPWLHFLGVILGNLIVNVGTVLIVDIISKRFAKNK